MKTCAQNFLLFILGCIFILPLSGCGGKTTGTASSDEQISPLSCLVVLPTLTPYDTSSAKMMGDGVKKGAAFLDRLIPAELQRSQVEQIIETAQLRIPIEEIAGEKLGAMKEISRKSGCGNLFVPTLSRFDQRQGGELAVDAPASAAFELKIVDLNSGKVMWMSSFNETQQSLFENLFSFGKAQSRGFKWITVEDLVSQGLKERLAECPYLYE